MPPKDILPTLYFLQQELLKIQDSDNTVNLLAPRILQSFQALGFNYSFLTTVFLDDPNNVANSLVADFERQEGRFLAVHQVMNLPNFLRQIDGYMKSFATNDLILFHDMNGFLQSTYADSHKLQTLVVFAIKDAQKVIGFVLMATDRMSKDITVDEQNKVRVLCGFLGLGYKMQNTQKSLTDITQQVYKMNAELHQLDRLKDDFVSVASHELRTPMTAIRSYAWMALYRSDMQPSEKLKKYLSRVLISTERLINLVNDMLNISRIESGRIDLTPQGFSMTTLVDDVLSEVETKAKEKNLNIQQLHITVPQVFADPDKVHQILLNLIGNAMKFTPVNGTILISYFTDGVTVETSVKDSGVGIPKEDMSRLFQKFGRLDSSYVAAATSGGTGLGLFICRKLVELMKGKIWAQSEGPGKGTTFIFSLPVATKEMLAEVAKLPPKPKGLTKSLEPVAI